MIQCGASMRMRSVVQCSPCRIHEMNVHAIKSMPERKERKKRGKRRRCMDNTGDLLVKAVEKD